MCFYSYSPYGFSFVCAKTAVTKSRQKVLFFDPALGSAKAWGLMITVRYPYLSMKNEADDPRLQAATTAAVTVFMTKMYRYLVFPPAIIVTVEKSIKQQSARVYLSVSFLSRGHQRHG